jgi:hypothetical protein
MPSLVRRDQISRSELSQLLSREKRPDLGAAMFEGAEFNRGDVHQALKAGNNSHLHIADPDKKPSAQERENGNPVE